MLKELAQKRTASMVVIRGRRRIGKSRLVEEFGKEYTNYIFTGIPPTEHTTIQSQLDEFTRQMCRLFHLPDIKFSDWGDVFWYLSEKIRTGRIILVFDEISWMGSKDPDFLGKLKTAWDVYFKKNGFGDR